MIELLTLAFIIFVLFQLISCLNNESDKVDGLTAKAGELGLLKEEDPMKEFNRRLQELKNKQKGL